MNRIRMIHALMLMLVALPVPVVHAQQSSEEQVFEQQAKEFMRSLDMQRGEIILNNGLATLQVPQDYYFLNSADARRVLVDVWGNPPEVADVLGMLFPKQYTPFDDASWAVTIEYVEEGYISDGDAGDINYDKLLRDMQSETRKESRAREDAGYEPIELLRWAEPPHYDATSKKLYWAQELRFGEMEETTLNYDIRALGRKGYLSMTFIAAGSQLAEINESREAVLSMVAFNEGNRYTDFDPSIDKVAAYGIGALIAGKVAAKAGLFAAALLLLKKFGVFLLIGLAAFGRKIMSLFGGQKS